METSLRNKVCPACGKTYVNLKGAETHLRKKHPSCTESLIILSPGAVVPQVTKPPKTWACGRCPIPAFRTKAEKKKHVKAVHTPTSKCPICSAAVKVKKLSNHVRKNHGNTNSSVEAANQAAPQSPRNGSLAGSLAANSLRVPGEGVYPSTWTSGPVQTHEDSATGSTHNLTLGRFYCQEHDCGRGFSSEAHLESHTRFFHQTKPAQTTAGEEGANPSPKNIPEEAEESVKTSPAHSTSTVGSSESGEYTLHDLLHTPSPAEAPALTLPQEGHQVIPSSAGMSVQGAFGSSATTPGEVSAPPAVTTSSPLSFRCRMCDAPPTVCMRPTATMCGHVFCYECITQHVTSTPRCPVCDGALLLYCLFKLDLPVLP